jgi:tubulin monoglycylase TTLL3/8
MSVEPKKPRKPKISLRNSSKRRDGVVDFVKNPSFTDEANLLIFKDLEAKAHSAINGKRIFTVLGGFDVIRHSMVARGWIEKILDIPPEKAVVNEKMISDTTCCFDTRRFVLSHLVKRSPVYFIWQPKHFDGILININYPLRNRINRLRTSDYTLKEGLHNLAENIQWHIIEDVSELNYPRSYLLMDLYQREFFLNEYRRTMITSFLFFLNDHDNFDRLFSESASIPIDLIYNCIHRIDYCIKLKQHLSIDLDKAATNLAYSELAKQIDLVVNQRKKIRYPEYNHTFSMEKLKTNVKVAVAEIHVYWPESKYDGHKNIWILKPINKSRGIGVVLMKDIEKIFDHVIRHTENKYICQKYCGKFAFQLQ